MTWTVLKQFENLEEAKVADGMAAKESVDEKIEDVAEKAAKRAAKTEQEYDRDRARFPI